MNIDYIKCGDCLELMKDLPDNSIDCIVTSPPYNKKGLSSKGNSATGNNHIWKKFTIDYDQYLDNMPEDKYSEWQTLFLDECYRVLKETGSVWYNHKIRRANNKAYFPNWVFNTKLNLYQMVIWDRLNCCDMRNDYLYPTTELIFWLCKLKPTVYKEQGFFTNEVWKIPPTQNTFHPAAFPIELVKNCILLSTKPNDIVLDPFIGSGTTAVACVSTQRHYIGFDVSAEYVRKSVDRLNSGIQLELI